MNLLQEFFSFDDLLGPFNFGSFLNTPWRSYRAAVVYSKGQENWISSIFTLEWIVSIKTMFYYGSGRFHDGGGDNFAALPPRSLPVHHHYAQQFPMRSVNWQDVSTFISACAVKEATGNHSVMPITRRQPGNVGRDDVIWRTETGPTYSCCCVPTGCARYGEDRINPSDPGDSVKVICTSPGCAVGRWMHADCFDEWQRRTAYNMR